MKPIYQETVSVIASDLTTTTWTELYELWQRATAIGENPLVIAELDRLLRQVKMLHDDIMKLTKFYPPEVT